MISPAASPTAPRAKPNAPVVLVVEDEALIRMMIVDHLRDCGFAVLEAATAAEAMAVINATPHIDVVFSDVRMPGGMDGFGLARWVRSARPGTSIVLTSGVEKPTEAANALCDGGPLVAKPYDVEEVEQRIRILAAGASER